VSALDRLDERFWYAWMWVGAVREWEAVKNKRKRATATYACKKVGRFETKPGRFLLYAGWAILTAWLLPHFSEDIEAVSETLSP
jgi:hypothetical protein